MKISSQEEYGLRVLLRIASCKDAEGISIPQLSEAEGLSSHYVAKLTRSLRLADIIKSTPGSKGGYLLARSASDIIIRDVLAELGGVMFDKGFCGRHNGIANLCTNSVNCSVRSLWRVVQVTVDRLLSKITLEDLLSSEKDSLHVLNSLVEV
ncbi:MAG: Rrf2 family transcriptional regulator [Ferruginibacter sp.]|nr:Rrf2 family transcriptional regulator [Ferruginibacter sp.]